MKRRFLIFISFIWLSPAWVRAAEPPLEYQVKAVCILNAARFVSWPAKAFGNESSPLIIGILGKNPFGTTLEHAVKGETVQKRRIIVQELGQQQEATACHILIVSRSERALLAAILKTLENTSVLTVSEIEGFASDGGMLGLGINRGTVRFEVNTEAVRRAGLKVDSRLLRLAKIVK